MYGMGVKGEREDSVLCRWQIVQIIWNKAYILGKQAKGESGDGNKPLMLH